MPTPAFNVERPNEVWVLDARPLPIYTRHQGILTIPSLLLCIDHKSHYPIGARLIPRTIVDANGNPKRADVRRDDVGLLLATLIYELNIRPDRLYTDNGSCIIGVGDILADLLADGELLTRFARSIPGRPRGRGAIEWMLQLFDRLLIDLPGNMVPNPEDPKKKDHFSLVSNAKAAENLLDLEGPKGLQGKVDQFIEELRDEPRRQHGKHTRRQLWTTTGSLSAFPIREVMRLLPKELRVERDAAIDEFKITFRYKEHGGDFEPRLNSDQDWDMWLLASSRPERVPLRAMNIDTGWKVEVCLDRTPSVPYWCELILKEKQMIDVGYRMERINASLQRIRTQYKDLVSMLSQAEQQIGLSTIVKRPGAGPERLRDAEERDDHTQVAGPSAAASSKSPAVSVSTRVEEGTPVKKPQKKAIDIALLMREAEEEMGQ